MKYKDYSQVKDFLANYSHKHLCNEICGFVGWDKDDESFVVEMKNNIATDPRQFFMIDAMDYLDFKDRFEMLAVFHSHIKGDESPSEFDIKMSESCCVPFLIYSINTKKFHIYTPHVVHSNVTIIERLKDDSH